MRWPRTGKESAESDEDGGVAVHIANLCAHALATTQTVEAASIVARHVAADVDRHRAGSAAIEDEVAPASVDPPNDAVDAHDPSRRAPAVRSAPANIDAVGVGGAAPVVRNPGLDVVPARKHGGTMLPTI